MSLKQRHAEIASDLVAGKTLQQIGDKFGVSRQAVHHVIKNCLGDVVAYVPKPPHPVFISPYDKKLFVYVIQASNGAIKIGHSADPAQRIKTINLHSPLPCRLIAVLEGKMKDELTFHRRFAEHRSHSEWFKDEGEVSQFIAEITGAGLSRIVDWSEVTNGFLTRDEKAARSKSLRSARMKEVWRKNHERMANAVRQGKRRSKEWQLADGAKESREGEAA